MRRRFRVSKEYSERPARPDGTCFYCSALVGEEHNEGCVIRSKTVVVTMSVRLCIAVPEDWSAEDVVFHRNDSSWCANNAIQELQDAADMVGCLCERTTFGFISEASAEDENLLGVAWNSRHLDEVFEEEDS